MIPLTMMHSNESWIPKTVCMWANVPSTARLRLVIVGSLVICLQKKELSLVSFGVWDGVWSCLGHWWGVISGAKFTSQGIPQAPCWLCRSGTSCGSLHCSWRLVSSEQPCKRCHASRSRSSAYLGSPQDLQVTSAACSRFQPRGWWSNRVASVALPIW